jgi:hypothetical protein
MKGVLWACSKQKSIFPFDGKGFSLLARTNRSFSSKQEKQQICKARLYQLPSTSLDNRQHLFITYSDLLLMEETTKAGRDVAKQGQYIF